MALNTQALTTVARFKNFASITGVTYDTRIEVLINVITDFVEHYCDRRFLETTYTQQIHDGNGSSKLLLKQYPINTRNAFQLDVRDTDLNENQFSSVDTNTYHIDYDTGLLEAVTFHFAEVPRKYQVTYTAGYAFKNDAAPLITLESLGIGDLEYAVWVLVNNLFKNASSPNNVKAETIGNYSVTFGDFEMLDPEIKMILNKYKRPHLM
jgi:hypothetical protein